MIGLVCLAAGAVWGATSVVVALLWGRGISALRAPKEQPAATATDAGDDVGVDLLADVPAELLSDVDVDRRFRQIVSPDSTWERWA